jgi:nitroreductase
MDALIANRHSCRRYQKRNVERKIIDDMIARLANAPNGGNKQQVEFTLIDDMEQMDVFRHLAYTEMEKLAAQGIYPEGFDKASYEDMKRWEQTVRPDMLFCGAPHLLVPHAPLGRGEPVQDVLIAGTYFELLCASRGLGAVMLTFPLGVLNCMPGIKAMLEIPEDHYIGMLIGFGYPQIPYARGTQRVIEESRIHRPDFRKAGN